MAVTTNWKAVLIILILLNSILGQPSCRTRLYTDVSCVAGKDDYKLQRGLVSDNNKTISIILKACRITEVDLDAFKNNYNLEEIDLSRNKIRSLQKEVFDGTQKLLSIRLSQNLLTELPSGIFDQLPRLQRLDISDNKINSLELGIFDRLPKLQRLELAGNLLQGKNMNPLLFANNPNIVFLHLSSNNMSSTPDNLLHALQSLSILGLNNCSLTEVPKFATSSNLKTMKTLLLQANEIRSIADPETFAYLENLETLDLIGNAIGYLNESVFKPLTKLKTIDLSFNEINQIPDNLFRDMKSVQSIDMSHNSIQVVPVNAFRGTRLKTLDLSVNRISFLDSNFCLELRNSQTKLTTFYFNDNPMHCPCLLEILKEVRKFRIAYNSDKYNGMKAVCFMTDEFNCLRHKTDFEIPLDFVRTTS